MQVRWIALLALVHTSVGSISAVPPLSSVAASSTVGGLKEAHSRNVAARDGRRRGGKKSRSTSSSSGERFQGSRQSADSLGVEDSSDTSSSEGKTTRWSKIPGEGWRKWHRTCEPCPEEMVKKWRDPTIRWICGGYQRARRSFKSECMMRYRNCQDGTMFVKLHDHRCDDKVPGWNHGRHFFYDYTVKLFDESSASASKDSSESESDSDDYNSSGAKDSSADFKLSVVT